MLYFMKVLFSLVSPPGIWVLVLAVISAMIYKSKRNLSLILGALAATIYISSIPIVADQLVRSLESKYYPPEQLNGEVLIILAGGTTADTPGVGGPGHPSGETSGRIITTAALHHKYQLPIIISGGQVYKEYGTESEIIRNSLIALGVTDESIIVENKSRSTEENALYVYNILENNGFKAPILVTSALHMARSVKHFEDANISVIPYPTGYMSSRKTRIELNTFLPSYEAVNKTGHAFKEYAGLFM